MKKSLVLNDTMRTTKKKLKTEGEDKIFILLLVFLLILVLFSLLFCCFFFHFAAWRTPYGDRIVGLGR